jgi:hypothetical protein
MAKSPQKPNTKYQVPEPATFLPYLRLNVTRFSRQTQKYPLLDVIVFFHQFDQRFSDGFE